ncbi:hypothetical protein CEXT_251421 [Caerostris extrusa]|uniref:Uncharacterized protein n=1 Tax=Caerostris extrusa TaxID=172846 RepID=A0AAV4NDQ6_CAEEX|nr:hypothetical protein CEXT_251421 [Caerostris extrusa]
MDVGSHIRARALFLRYLIAAHTEPVEGCPGDGHSRNRDIKSMFATTASFDKNNTQLKELTKKTATVAGGFLWNPEGKRPEYKLYKYKASYSFETSQNLKITAGHASPVCGDRTPFPKSKTSHSLEHSPRLPTSFPPNTTSKPIHFPRYPRTPPPPPARRRKKRKQNSTSTLLIPPPSLFWKSEKDESNELNGPTSGRKLFSGNAPHPIYIIGRKKRQFWAKRHTPPKVRQHQVLMKTGRTFDSSL